MHILTIKEKGLGRYSDVSPFPLGDLEIDIQGIPNYNGEFRFFGACNGVQCAFETVTAAQSRVTIPRDKLSAGRFSCRVVHYIGGKEVRIFKAEDLLITDVATDFSAVPEIVALEEKIGELSTSLDKEKTARADAEAKAKDAKEYADNILIGLVRFAYADYRQNVYLDGTPNFDGFLQAFKINFSEEDKIKVKGE